MKFQVEISDDLFWKIAARAETFDQRVPEYAADLLIAAAHVRSPVDSDPVLRLWRGGLTDAQIARHLNLTNLAVSSRRRRFGLPANRRRKEEVA